MQSRVILAFGLPRSGTTWIGKIFDSHPDTLYLHEPDSGQALGQIPLVAPVEESQLYRQAVEAFVGTLPENRSTKVAGSLPLFPKRYYSPPRYLLRQAGVMLAKLGAKAFGEWPVPTLVPHRARPSVHVVWKSIESIGRLGVIVRNLPRRRAIVILRHPCGYVASVLRGEAKRRFTSEEPSAEDYEVLEMLLATPQARQRGLTMAAMKALDPAERLAWRWVLFNEKALADNEDQEGCTWVRYEDVCADPAGKARELLEFAGLSWHSQGQRFIRESTSRDSGAYYSIVKNPERAAHGWRNELPADTADRVLRVLKQSRLAELYL